MSSFLRLNRPALVSLAAGLETGRLHAPFYESSLARYVPGNLCREVLQEFNQLQAMGATADHLAYTLRLLAAERESSQDVRDRIDLVWTGQEVADSESRDTRVVVRELFSTAKTSVLISSFAIDKGKKARELFGVLAERMDANLELQVRMFLNVHRPYKSEAPDSTLLREFADTFRKEIWPGQRLPEVFHDPRSLAMGTEEKASLHAKCVVVDDERLLVTSANFTQAAHGRNIEAGVLLADSVAARAMRAQFETLVTQNILHRVPRIR